MCVAVCGRHSGGRDAASRGFPTIAQYESPVGAALGASDGLDVGAELGTLGASLGLDDGAAVGASLGLADGVVVGS